MINTRKSASWVIVNKETGESVFETFQESILPKLNTDKYEAIPVLEYLYNINAQIKAGATGAISYAGGKS